MKILVTGAAGKIGARTAARLAREGWDVQGTDLSLPKNFPGEFVVADLLRPETAYRLIEGCQAVVHLGNLPNAAHGTPQRVYSENCAMNVNVFQAAAEHGVERVIFASSIQAVATGVDAEGRLLPPPYLPLDSRMPHSCGNSYAVSKAAGEILLESLAGRELALGVAVRLPWVASQASVRWLRQRQTDPYQGVWPDGVWLHIEDAAECFRALMLSAARGFHRVFPARTREDSGITAEGWRLRHCPEVPLREGWSLPIETLVDVSDLDALCGWTPSRTLEDGFPE